MSFKELDQRFCKLFLKKSTKMSLTNNLILYQQRFTIKSDWVSNLVSNMPYEMYAHS